MFNILLYISLFVIQIYGSGELRILHHPEGVLFKGHDKLDESDLKEVYSAALGFSVEHSLTWAGLYITDPFQLAKGIVSIYIDGISDLEGVNGHDYPLRTDTDDEVTYDVLKYRIEQHYPNGNNKIIDINLSDGLDVINQYELLHDIKDIKNANHKYMFLKPNVEEDNQFIQELNLFNAITEKVQNGVLKYDNDPDFINIRFLSLHALSDLYGENSTTTKEAKQLLTEAINKFNEALNKAYSGNVLITIVSSDASHTRHVRQVTEGKATKDEDLNLAKTYDANYPVIFNIILWFGVIMVFSLLAISMAIGGMDPGRDSIIYRMTSTRMKKDN